MDHKAQAVINDLLQDFREKCFQVSCAGDLIDDVARSLGANRQEREELRERVQAVKDNYLR